jgi:hypothetical protein
MFIFKKIIILKMYKNLINKKMKEIKPIVDNIANIKKNLDNIENIYEVNIAKSEHKAYIDKRVQLKLDEIITLQEDRVKLSCSGEIFEISRSYIENCKYKNFLQNEITIKGEAIFIDMDIIFLEPILDIIRYNQVENKITNELIELDMGYIDEDQRIPQPIIRAVGSNKVNDALTLIEHVKRFFPEGAEEILEKYNICLNPPKIEKKKLPAHIKN